MRRPAKPDAEALARLGLRAAGVAHDLAQPLAAALLAARQVEGRGAERLREALHRIEDMVQSVRDGLGDAGKPRARIPADLARIQREVLACLTPAERRRTHLRLAGRCGADGLAVRRIVGNLVLNALRHGTGAVRGAGKARAGGLEVVIRGGPGKRAGEQGWGIGLASCQDLAGRHGLVLTVEISPTGSRAELRTAR